MAPKTGPRGVTIEDVQGVADNGRAGYTITRRDTASTIPTPSASDLAGLLVGGPQPGYGQKYGGLGSATNLNAAVKGNVYNFLALQQALADRAGLQTAGLANAYDVSQRTAPNMYGSMPTLTDQQRATASQLADVRRELALREAAKTLNPDRYYGRDLTAQTKDGVLPTLGAITSGGATLAIPVAAGLVRNVFGITDSNAERERNKNVYDFALAAKEAALQSKLGNIYPSASQMQAQATDYQKQAGDYITGKIAENPAMRLSETAGAITPSQFAQLVATQQYGVPAAVAAGQYGPGFEANIITEQARLASAKMPDFSKSDAQVVYERYGEEALAQYEANQAEKALGGTLEQQTAAAQAQQDIANIATDNGIYSSLGFTPAMVTTNKADADGIRQRIANDPEFAGSVQNAVSSAMEKLANGDALEDVQSTIITDYYNQTGDQMGAKYLADIVAYFGSSF